MDPLIKQILTLVTSDTGSLAYHLILAFSVLWALQLTLGQPGATSSVVMRRIMSGLVLLFLLQVALFVTSGLGWQGILNAVDWLPPIDRAVILLSLVVIIWLWAFAQPAPSADVATLLLGLLGVTGAVLGALWWMEQPATLSFNQTWLDIAVQIASLAVIGLGCLLLATRRPENWVQGLMMLLVLGAGHILHLLLPVEGDYAGAVRYAQMAAYSFLLVLPQRLPAATPAAASVTAAAPAATADRFQGRLYADPQVWQSLQTMVMENDPQRVCQLVTSSIARIMQADLCLLAMPPDANGKVQMRCGFDQTRSRYFEPLLIDSSGLPVMLSALRMGRVRRLNSHSTSLDLPGLTRALSLERTGNVLFVPVLSPDGKPILSVILMSPYSNKDWTSEEQTFLSAFARPLVYFLQRNQEMTATRDEVNQTRQALRTAQDQAQLAIEDRRKLRDQITVLKEEGERGRQQMESMAKMLADQMEAQASNERLQAANDHLMSENQRMRISIQGLQDENERLQEIARSASEAAFHQGETVEIEMRRALEQVAYLQTLLADADQKISALKLTQANASPSKVQLEAVGAIAQELRQPLSSIVGYVDFLLAESVGILGAVQRKYLERAKISTERMGRLIDDLLQAISVDSNNIQFDIGDVNLGSVLHAAVAENGQLMREKNLTLRMDQSEETLFVQTDQYALRRVFAMLLQNACNVSPIGGSIALGVRRQSAEGERDYVQVQVADTGGGIAVHDLPNVFSPRQVNKAAGEGNGSVDLASVKTLVEALGGRTWVDSEMGVGATYSVLLPTITGGSAR